MEGRLLEESGWYCGSSDGWGSSERRRIRSEAGRVLGGLASYELRLGYFIPNNYKFYGLIKLLAYELTQFSNWVQCKGVCANLVLLP